MPYAPSQIPIPGYLQGAGLGGLQKFQSQIPGLYDTSDLRQSTTNLENSNMNRGAAIASAATAAYANRAQQSGASQLGAGFAGAQAMLPFYAQNAQLENQFSGQRLQNNQQQAGQMGNIAAQLAQLRQAHQGMLADYTGRQQQLAQNQSQFNSDLGFRNQQLKSQNDQFDIQFLDSRRRYNDSRNDARSPYGLQMGGSPGGAGGYYPQGDAWGQAPLPQGVLNKGYIPNSGPIQAAQLAGGRKMLSATQPWDNTPSSIEGWGTAAFGGGGPGKDPNPPSKQQNPLLDYLRSIQGGGGSATTNNYYNNQTAQPAGAQSWW